MTSKDMGDIVTPAGTMNFTVFYDETIITNSSNIPSASESVISVGELVDILDVEVYAVSIPDINIVFRENYSVYADGVWNRMFEGVTQFRLYLDEGSGDTFYFWGTVNKAGTSFEIIASSGGTTYRTVNAQLISILKDIENISPVEIKNDIMDNRISNLTDVDYGYSSAYFYKISDIFESMVYLTFGGTFGNRVAFPGATNNDMQYLHDATWYNISSLYGYGKYGYPVVNQSSLFAGTNEMNWGTYFKNGLEILSYLCRQFGLIPRITCNVSTSVIGLKLLQRGRSSDVTLPMEVAGCSYSLANENKRSDLRAKNRNGYTDDGYEGITFLLDYLVNSGTTPYDQALFVSPSAPNVHAVSGFRYFDVQTGLYVETISGLAARNIQGVGDYYSKLYSKNSRTEERNYKSIQGSSDSGSTWSHEVMYAGINTDISDGITTRTYYANEVRKNIMTNEMTIQWIEE